MSRAVSATIGGRDEHLRTSAHGSARAPRPRDVTRAIHDRALRTPAATLGGHPFEITTDPGGQPRT